MKNKHMSSIDRVTIENGLNASLSFKSIANNIGKDCTTVSKEIRNNLISRNISAIGRVFNNCLYRFDCDRYSVCSPCLLSKSKKCSTCKFCRNECDHFVEELCPNLSTPPYVCNGCRNRSKCTLTKHLCHAIHAHKLYQQRLRDSRKGFIIDENEILYLNQLLTPLIQDQGQSIHHVFINHKDEIMRCEKSLYNLIDQGVLNIRNIDLPRKVKYRPRRKKSTTYKIDKRCLEGRRYEDFERFIEEHPDKAIVEIDTVEGVKSESCLLTIHFTVSSFMIATKRKHNDSQSVIDFFTHVYDGLGREMFRKLFPVILADNGSEFSNPAAIEFDDNGRRRTYVFYCHPGAPYEKGSCEVNHELIRRIIPQGVSWNSYTQKDINLMMSHINSYARERLNDKCPTFIFSCLFNEEVSNFFNISYIEADSIVLKKRLLSK